VVLALIAAFMFSHKPQNKPAEPTTAAKPVAEWISPITQEPEPSTIAEPTTVKPTTLAEPMAAKPATVGEPIHERPPLRSLLRRVHELRELGKEGKSTSAREMLTELEASDSRVAGAVRLALADIEYTVGNYDQAIHLSTQALRLGADVDALVIRADAELKAGRIREADRDFARVLKLQPENSDAREGRKIAQQQQLREESP
jgi:tetratricopeptide (TPR) repeat protein